MENILKVLVITETKDGVVVNREKWVETGKPYTVYNICNGKYLLVGQRGTKMSLLHSLYRSKRYWPPLPGIVRTCHYQVEEL